MSSTQSDRIEKKVVLRAPRSRVWSALTNAREFGEWFRVKLDGDFVVGKSIEGKIMYPGWEHVTMRVDVERIEPEKLFAYRWHPHAVDPDVDYSKESTTLVEFRLEDAPEGTVLTVIESGFDKIPLARREKAFRMNDDGWQEQMENIRRHVKG